GRVQGRGARRERARPVRGQGRRTGEEGARQEGARQEGARQEGARQEGARQEGARQEGRQGRGACQEGACQEGARQEGRQGRGARQEGVGQEGPRQEEREEGLRASLALTLPGEYAEHMRFTILFAFLLASCASSAAVDSEAQTGGESSDQS